MDRIESASGFDKAIIRDFLAFPKKLYEDGNSPQDIKAEKQILGGKHVLSKDITVMPFLVYVESDGKKTTAARCLVTYYSNDDNAYVGFFESEDNLEVCKRLFQDVRDYAKKDEKKKLVGPVDASFWIRYRFKSSSDAAFYNTYSSEPYNKEYYAELWEKCGFAVCDIYESNMYRQVRADDISTKLRERYARMCERGYHIKKSSIKTFDNDLVEIHRLIKKPINTFRYIRIFQLNNLKQCLDTSNIS